MKYFEQALTHMRIHGVVWRNPQLSVNIASTNLGVYAKRLLDVQPIVFTDKQNTVGLDENMKESFGPVELELDAPFKAFSIEMLNEPLLVDRTPNGDDPILMRCFCTIVFEEEPKCFTTLNLMHAENLNSGKEGWVVIQNNATASMVQLMIKRLNTEAVGYEPCKRKLRIGQGKEKTDFEIRRIVHVVPKQQHPEYAESNSKIDWSHRWFVRGHWRNIKSGLGKDRAGVYNTPNFTWVSEHEKGPDELPLISKVRLVKNL